MWILFLLSFQHEIGSCIFLNNKAFISIFMSLKWFWEVEYVVYLKNNFFGWQNILVFYTL